MSEWITEEFNGCELGDKRFVKRLKMIVERMWQSPLASITAACRGFAEVMAASRFFHNEQVSQEQLLAPHREATILRVAQHQQVLYIQDTTELDFTAKKNLKGTGPLSNLERRGFFAHNELVLSPERLALGLWHTCIEARKD
jgi:transposase-like protein